MSLSTDSHPIDTLRLDVVGLRAELRAARQDLVRKKRVVARQATLHARTAKEREAELDRLVHEHPEVMALEDQVLRLQHAEETKVAQLENALRVVQEEQWFIRNKLSDGLMELAASVATSPLAHLSLAAAASVGERSAYLGAAAYIEDREIR